MPQKDHTRFEKTAFRLFQLNAVSEKSFENLFKVLQMFLLALSGNNDVVYIARCTFYSLEYGVHRSLEHRWCGSDPEGKPGVLKEPFVCIYRDILPGVFIQNELIVGVRKVQGSKSLTSRQSGKNFIRFGQRVLIHV